MQAVFQLYASLHATLYMSSGDRMAFIISNVICMLVTAVLLVSIGFQREQLDKTASRFSLLAHMLFGFLTNDLLCTILDGKPEYSTLAYILNLLDFIWIDAIVIAFSAYLSSLIGRTNKKWKNVMNPGVFFTYIRIVVTLVLAGAGKLFTINENGFFQECELIYIPYVIQFGVLLMLMLVVINNKRYLAKSHLTVMLAYLVLPILGAVLELLTKYYALSVISITTSVLLICTMVQTKIIEEGRVRESILEEISSTDLLTGLKNRRAYYSRFSRLRSDESIGVVFCDINRLKYTNDHYGHAEGDKLIVRFTKLLAEVFEFEDIFRISGDEFVILSPNLTQQAFSKLFDDLREKVSANNDIAALGSSYGTGCLIEELVNVAESAMYNDKRDYYTRNHISRGELTEH